MGLLNSQVGADNFQYVYWQSPTAQPVTLAPLPTGETPRTLFINTKSQIVASSLEGHAYLWSSPSAQPTQLPALTHGTTATMQALGLNNNGLIIGRANFGASSSLAVYWKAGQVTDINTVLPAGQTLILDVALSMNDQGQVVCDNIGQVVGNVGDVIVTIK